MNSFAASAHRRRICLLEFAIVLQLKNNKRTTFQRGNATAANESTLRMWLDYPHLFLFGFFPFLIFQNNVTSIRCIYSSFQDYVHPYDHTEPTYTLNLSHLYKPFTLRTLFLSLPYGHVAMSSFLGGHPRHAKVQLFAMKMGKPLFLPSFNTLNSEGTRIFDSHHSAIKCFTS